jgi:peptidyl-prolyl cis-trans isomerase B (cyclophilin B)
MARGDGAASATTSFFIVTGDASSLDGKYKAFGRVVEGLSAVEAIEQNPCRAEDRQTREVRTRAARRASKGRWNGA